MGLRFLAFPYKWESQQPSTGDTFTFKIGLEVVQWHNWSITLIGTVTGYCIVSCNLNYTYSYASLQKVLLYTQDFDLYLDLLALMLLSPYQCITGGRWDIAVFPRNTIAQSSGKVDHCGPYANKFRGGSGGGG